jgi:hypothetical protein
VPYDSAHDAAAYRGAVAHSDRIADVHAHRPKRCPLTVAHYTGANAAAVNGADGPAIAPSLASAHGSLRRSE